MHTQLPCNFCFEVDLASKKLGFKFAETAGLVALPTIGCFKIGYSLIIPKRHITSFAFQTENQLSDTEDFLEQMRELSQSLFGPTITAEHGTGAPEEPTAACCDHAHLHLIPTTQFEKIRVRYVDCGGAPKAFERLREVKRLEGLSYQTLSDRRGHWLVWIGASRFQRQWIRRTVSAAEGDEGQFDWRLYPHREKMIHTSQLFRLACSRASSP